jgi:hypothetical protein
MLKTYLPYVLVAFAVLVAGGWIWHSLGSSSSADGPGEGYPVVCSQPGCGHFFVISPSDIETYPRGPNGEGFKCAKCGRFGARVAVQCDQCKQWYLPQEGGRGAVACPRCAPKPVDKKAI